MATHSVGTAHLILALDVSLLGDKLSSLGGILFTLQVDRVQQVWKEDCMQFDKPFVFEALLVAPHDVVEAI